MSQKNWTIFAALPKQFKTKEVKANSSVSFSSTSQEKGHDSGWHSDDNKKLKAKTDVTGPTIKALTSWQTVGQKQADGWRKQRHQRGREMFDRHVGAERVEKLRSRHWLFMHATVLSLTLDYLWKNSKRFHTILTIQLLAYSLGITQGHLRVMEKNKQIFEVYTANTRLGILSFTQVLFLLMK